MRNIYKTEKMCLIDSFICECPSVSYSDLAIKPVMRTPLDKLGFPQKFCWCCSLRVATAFICIFSFFWALLELITAEKDMASVFPERSALLLYVKVMYMLMCLFFILACSALFFGIIIRRHQPVHFFIWYGFVFNCMFVVFLVATAIASIIENGHLKTKKIFTTVLGFIWSCIYFYLLMVVNSYKLILW